MAMKNCPKCGSTEIDTGAILSAGRVLYKTDLQRHLFQSPNIVTYCCLACGYVESYVNESYRLKIRKLMARVDSPK